LHALERFFGRHPFGACDRSQCSALAAYRDVATRLGIRGAPTLVVFRDGKEVKRRVGAGSRSALRELVEHV
jgi:thiol-disulfide isomerase/thioredoxin